MSPAVPTENLILIPTVFESSLIASQLNKLLRNYRAKFYHCGFGPIASAALTTEKIIIDQPSNVFLVGIAGAYRNEHPSSDSLRVDSLRVGAAYRFTSVGIDGIGVGEAESFQSASDLGWSQFAGDEQRDPIPDALVLDSNSPHRLLTVCSASSSSHQASRRQQSSTADAEDMEGFAVALACRLQNVSLQIIRGISNVAGERDKSNWRIADAMVAAVDQLQVALRELE